METKKGQATVPVNRENTVELREGQKKRSDVETKDLKRIKLLL